jgi:hypothetical protein
VLELRINRKNFHEVAWADSEHKSLAAGQVRFALKQCALSANNITYADLGETFRYWQFFPTQAGFGLLPVWGFAEVVESVHDDFKIGERAYGYWPLAQSWVLNPQTLGAKHFVDSSPERAALPAVYQRYQRWRETVAAGAQDEFEGFYALLRPLYMTAWLCADFLRDQSMYGAHSVVVLSASSRTAMSLAQAMQRLLPEVHRLGLTSQSNLDWCRQSGLYHEVLSYEAIVDAERRPAVLVDVAGNLELRARVHHQFAEALRYSSALGLSHRGQAQNLRNPAMVPGPRSELFFAPNQVDKRLKQHGPGWIEQQSNPDWQAMMELAPRLIALETRRGLGEIRSAYLQVLNAQTSPKQGIVLEFD